MICTLSVSGVVDEKLSGGRGKNMLEGGVIFNCLWPPPSEGVWNLGPPYQRGLETITPLPFNPQYPIPLLL